MFLLLISWSALIQWTIKTLRIHSFIKYKTPKSLKLSSIFLYCFLSFVSIATLICYRLEEIIKYGRKSWPQLTQNIILKVHNFIFPSHPIPLPLITKRHPESISTKKKKKNVFRPLNFHNHKTINIIKNYCLLFSNKIVVRHHLVQLLFHIAPDDNTLLLL